MLVSSPGRVIQYMKPPGTDVEWGRSESPSLHTSISPQAHTYPTHNSIITNLHISVTAIWVQILPDLAIHENWICMSSVNLGKSR